MSAIKFLVDNYADLSLLPYYLESSENTSYPVLNIFNKKRRSKVWRSNGYFNVVAGDNTIVFNEGGSDLTATVAVAEYFTTASFMAAVDTALSTAPGAAGSYTVTQNSNFKFVLTKSAGTFNIKWTDAGSLDMAALMGFDTATDDTGALAYTADVLRISSPNEWILFDLGVSSIPTAFCITGPRNKPFKLSPSGVFKLEANYTNNFASPPFSQTLTYDDEVIALINDDGISDIAYRYWRIVFEDQNPNGYVELGALFLGVSTAPNRGCVQFPLEIEPIDRTENILSESGVNFSDIREQTGRITMTWRLLTKEDREKFLEIFERFGTGLPFFMSLDTQSAYSSVQNRMIKFVQFAGEPKFTLESPNNFSCQMTVIEQL